MSYSPVQFIQFSLLTGQQWEEYGVCEITKPNTHGIGDLTNTVYDERMGVLEANKECYTCGYDSSVCPGHPGYIKLAAPIFNIKLISTVQNVIKCVCVECGALRIPTDLLGMKNILMLKGGSRLKALIKICKKAKRCPECQHMLPISLNKEGVECVYSTEHGEQTVTKSPEEILNLFEKITETSVKVMGFNGNLASNRPFQHKFALVGDKTYVEHRHRNYLDSLIFTVLPVIPPFARTWVIRNGVKSDDDLTEKYNTIVKLNQRLYDQELSVYSREDLVRKLEEHVNTLIDNQNETCTGMNRTHRGLADRIQGKGNRMQENVMAKRSDFSARTVLASGGPEIRFGEIGVPRAMTKILTVKVRVTPQNFEAIQKTMCEGHINSLWRWNRTQNKMGYKGLATDTIKKKVGLRINDIVERSLSAGDWVLLNRQPTLRRESMIGCKVVIIEDDVFRIPLAITSPLGADFDGDEANIHVPQNIQATAECRTVMSASEHIVTCQRNAPICGIVQDGLVTAYLLTRRGAPRVAWPTMCDALVSANAPFDTIEFFARAFRFYPADIRFDQERGVHHLRGDTLPGALLFSALLPPDFQYRKRTNTDPLFPEVLIENGVILPGSGPLCKKIIGAKENSIVHVLWLEYFPAVAQDFISHVQIVTDIVSSTLGFSMGLGDCYISAPEKIGKLLTEMDAQYEALIKKNHSDPRLEQKLNAELNSAMSRAPPVVNETLSRGSANAASVMKVSGAKGQDVNATQIAAFVGQQNVGGKRPDLSLAGRTRSLPFFPAGDHSPASRGFIYGNYLTGQEPHEAFFAAMSGRSGIIDTACKTSETGYIQKRIVQKVCDLQIRVDGTVRDARDRIVQFVYGGDGMDPRFLATPLSCLDLGFPFFIDPVQTAGRFVSDRYPPPPLVPLSAAVLDTLTSDLYIGLLQAQTVPLQQARRNIIKVLRQLAQDIRMPEARIPAFCKQVVNRFRRALSASGDMVGQHLASSMGEITTQLVLSFFHFAGMSLKDASLGVPRFVELLNLTKVPATPSCTVYSVLQGQKGAEQTARSIGELALGRLLVSPPQLLYAGPEPLDPESVSPADFCTYNRYEQPWWISFSHRLRLSRRSCPEADRSVWVVQLNFDRMKLLNYRFTLQEIASAIEAEGNQRFICICSPFALAEIHVEVSLINLSTFAKPSNNNIKNKCATPANYEFLILRDVVKPFLETVHLRGIVRILRASATQVLGSKKDAAWVVETLGSNLCALLGHPLVDSSRTISNNPREIRQVLGIEAARSFLVEEITRVLSFDGTYINAHHVPLLVDAMCHRGNLSAVRRDGIDRHDVGPIAKAAFEMTVDNTFTSAIFSEHDDMQGFSAQIMFGQSTKCGTGSVTVK